MAGRRILLTRAEDDCLEWAQRLEHLGALPVVFPCIECRDLDTPQLRARLAKALPAARWLIFTSRRGVAAFAALQQMPLPEGVKVAVVGPATARAARDVLGRADLEGPGGTAASLAEALCDREGNALHRANVLLAVAESAGDVLERALAGQGARCTRLEVYRTIPAPPETPRRALSSLGADNVFLASPSAVTGFVHRVTLDMPAALYTIGPTTSAAARASGLVVTAEAREPSLEGLLEAMQWAK